MHHQQGDCGTVPNAVFVHSRCRDIGTCGDRPGADAAGGRRDRPGACRDAAESCRDRPGACTSTIPDAVFVHTSAPAETGLMPAQMQLEAAETVLVPAQTKLKAAETGLVSGQAQSQMLCLSTAGAETSVPAETGLMPTNIQLKAAETGLVPAEMQLKAAETGLVPAEMDQRDGSERADLSVFHYTIE